MLWLLVDARSATCLNQVLRYLSAMGALDNKTTSLASLATALLFVVAGILLVMGDSDPTSGSNDIAFIVLALAGLPSLSIAANAIMQSDDTNKRLNGMVFVVASLLFIVVGFVGSGTALVFGIAAIFAGLALVMDALAFRTSGAIGAAYIPTVMAVAEAILGVLCLVGGYSNIYGLLVPLIFGAWFAVKLWLGTVLSPEDIIAPKALPAPSSEGTKDRPKKSDVTVEPEKKANKPTDGAKGVAPNDAAPQDKRDTKALPVGKAVVDTGSKKSDGPKKDATIEQKVPPKTVQEPKKEAPKVSEPKKPEASEKPKSDPMAKLVSSKAVRKVASKESPDSGPKTPVPETVPVAAKAPEATVPVEDATKAVEPVPVPADAPVSEPEKDVPDMDEKVKVPEVPEVPAPGVEDIQVEEPQVEDEQVPEPETATPIAEETVVEESAPEPAPEETIDEPIPEEPSITGPEDIPEPVEASAHEDIEDQIPMENDPVVEGEDASEAIEEPIPTPIQSDAEVPEPIPEAPEVSEETIDEPAPEEESFETDSEDIPEPVEDSVQEEAPEAVQMSEADVEEAGQTIEEVPEEVVPPVPGEDGPTLEPVEDSGSSDDQSADDDGQSNEDLYTDHSPEALVRRAAWNKGLRCRRAYSDRKIPVAFVKGHVAVYVEGPESDTSMDEELRSEGWTVLRFDPADVTDGKAQADIISAAIKENLKASKKSKKQKK